MFFQRSRFKQQERRQAMTKNLKVCRKWQGNKPVPSVNLQGVYLQEHNFNIGDNVRVEFYRDEIRIKKMNAKQILQHMADDNPAIAQLVREFECEICD